MSVDIRPERERHRGLDDERPGVAGVRGASAGHEDSMSASM
jgi:hypothetical protein